MSHSNKKHFSNISKILLFQIILLISIVGPLVQSSPVHASQEEQWKKYGDLEIAGEAMGGPQYLRINSIKLGDNTGDYLSDDAKKLSIETLSAALQASGGAQQEYVDSNPYDEVNEWISVNGDCNSKIGYQEDRLKLTQLKANVAGKGCIEIYKGDKDPTIPTGMYESVEDPGRKGEVKGGLNNMFRVNAWFRRINSNTLERTTRYGGASGGTLYVATDPTQPDLYLNQGKDKDKPNHYVKLLGKLTADQAPNVCNTEITWDGDIDLHRYPNKHYCLMSNSPLIDNEKWQVGSLLEDSDYEGNELTSQKVERDPKIRIRNQLVLINSTAEAEAAEPTDTEAGAAEPTDPCEKIDDASFLTKVGHPIQWFICGIAGATARAIDSINEVIANLLSYNPTSKDEVKVVWNNVRNLANILFIIALLIVVISQALGVPLLDAYAVKRMLPRLIVAIILCNLSFVICSILIHFILILGSNIGNLMNGLSADPGAVIKQFNDPSGIKENMAAVGAGSIGPLAGVMILGIGALIYATLASGGMALVAVLVAGLFGVFMAYITLVLRQLLLVLLVIFSPLVFALWVIPGGEKYLSKWWKVFIELLLMYPIIMVMFSMGLFIAKVSPISGGGLAGLVPIAAMLAPYFMIPATFKAASSTLAAATGAINGKLKPMADKGKAWAKDRGSQSAWQARKKDKLEERHRNRDIRRANRNASRWGKDSWRGKAREKYGTDKQKNRAELANQRWENRAAKLEAQPMAEEAELLKTQRAVADLTLQKELSDKTSAPDMMATMRANVTKAATEYKAAEARGDKTAMRRHKATMDANIDKMAAFNDIEGLEAAKNEVPANVWQESVGRNYETYQNNNPYFTKKDSGEVNQLNNAAMANIRSSGWDRHFQESYLRGPEALRETAQRLIDVRSDPSAGAHLDHAASSHVAVGADGQADLDATVANIEKHLKEVQKVHGPPGLN